jgi:hypothetical protein
MHMRNKPLQFVWMNDRESRELVVALTYDADEWYVNCVLEVMLYDRDGNVVVEKPLDANSPEELAYRSWFERLVADRKLGYGRKYSVDPRTRMVRWHHVGDEIDDAVMDMISAAERDADEGAYWAHLYEKSDRA